MDEVKKVSKQTMFQIFGKIVTSGSTIIILSLVTRQYGEEQTGIFTLALVYLAFFYLAVDFGINSIVLPKLMKKNSSTQWQNLLGVRIVWSVVLIMIAFLGALFWPNQNELFKQSILFGSLAILGVACYLTTNAIFQAKSRYDLVFWSIFVGSTVSLGAIYIIAANKLSVSDLMIGYALGWLACGGLSLVIAKRFVNLYPLFDYEYLKTLLSAVWPIALTLIINTIYFRIDVFILTFFKGFTEVGVYNLAYQVFQSALVLPAFIINSYYPILISHFHKDVNLFRRNVIKITVGMMGIAGLGTLATLILSPLIINLLSGGHGFNGSVDALNILALSFPAYFGSSVLMWSLVIIKKQKLLLLVYLTGLMANLVLNLIFIPKFGFIAASVNTGIC